MGSSNSVCVNINLDRANPFYFAGESVSGSVNIQIKKGNIKVDEIFILLNGETGYTTTRTDTDFNGSSSTVTDYHDIPFFKAKKVFDHPNIGSNKATYDSGHYSWRFDIPLPDYLPPSINQPELYPHSPLVVDKPWYKRNTNEILFLTVFPHVNLSQIPLCLTSTSFGNNNRKDIWLRGNIDRIGYLPGETISGTFEIENPRRIVVKKLRLALIQHGYVQGYDQKGTICETIIASLDHRNDERIIDKFLLMIPAIALAPSYEFRDGYKGVSSASVRYYLEFQLKVEGVFTNFDVPIPITIGTETNRGLYRNEEQENSEISQNWVRSYPQSNSNTNVEPPPPNYYSIAPFHNQS